MFGETTAKLLLYLAPIQSASLVQYGYNTTAQEALIAEKAQIVYSYLPRRYQAIYQARVHRLIVVEYAKAGQTECSAPFSGMANAVGYLNPTGEITDLPEAETTTVIYNDAEEKLEFSALSAGDMLVIDFDNDGIESIEVKPLVWATNVLAAIDLMSIISGEMRGAGLIPRIQADADRIFHWLQALNSIDPSDSVIIKDLEFKFWEGTRSFARNIDLLSNAFAQGLTT